MSIPHIPMIHLNGTSRERLLEHLENLYVYIHDADTTLRECYPNMRDYYPFPDGQARYDAARERVNGWQRLLDSIRTDIEADIAAIEERRP